MFEELITKDDRSTITLKYDKKKYNIEYVKNKKLFILRRLSDNKILEIFSDKIGFIVQCDIEGQTNFLVTDYSEEDKNGHILLKFKHYTDRSYLDSLYLERSFDCDCATLSGCRITDCSYLVEQSGYTGCIYNLNQKSKSFERIYNDQKVNDFFNDNTLLVSEKVSAIARHDVNDTLTYGINPETFEITTPIWSELQQRCISIYTQEQADKLKEAKGLILNLKNLDEMTIYFEVERYLNEIVKQFDRPQSVYTDIMYSEINEEFVKKFVKNKKI